MGDLEADKARAGVNVHGAEAFVVCVHARGAANSTQTPAMLAESAPTAASLTAELRVISSRKRWRARRRLGGLVAHLEWYGALVRLVVDGSDGEMVTKCGGHRR